MYIDHFRVVVSPYSAQIIADGTPQATLREQNKTEVQHFRASLLPTSLKTKSNHARAVPCRSCCRVYCKRKALVRTRKAPFSPSLGRAQDRCTCTVSLYIVQTSDYDEPLCAKHKRHAGLANQPSARHPEVNQRASRGGWPPPLKRRVLGHDPVDCVP